jgi:nucleoside-diphosphate-sugar epimerase
MISVLLTGGSGFVGSHLREVLRDKPIILLGRREPTLSANECWFYADLAEPLDSRLLSTGKVLCHLAYSRTDGSKNLAYNKRLLDAVNNNDDIERVIFVSSISVYGTSTSSVVDEETPCNPVGEYAETKLACERLWWEGLRSDCALTVLRPSEIIGPGGELLLPLIEDVLRRPVVGLIKRSVLHHRPLHFVAVSNVVAAIRFCIDRAQTPSTREVYLVSDDHQPENRSYPDMQDVVLDACGRRPLPALPVPRPVLRALIRATGRSVNLEQSFSSRKIHDAGFEDACALGDEVRRVVRGVKGCR